ncbi:MAG: FecR domain-containing protein [Lachnospiraceae bacterium]|nr:FecR domain-containing protein [Lachnospiraceae bacterium]
MSRKALLIGSISTAAVAVAVAVVFIIMGNMDAYRSIKVFEINGSCTVTRGDDTLDAFKDMALSSGDSLSVGDSSFARLKLDDDKFVYLEAGTKIELYATGTQNDSKTRVYISRGSMMTEVTRKLSARSSYDIITPNTSLAIRGTKVLTQVLEDAVTGQIKSCNAILEGLVSIKGIKLRPDGTVIAIERELGPGESISFTTDKDELVSAEDMMSIAETGKTVDGVTVDTIPEEEGMSFETIADEQKNGNLRISLFDDAFLDNIKEILVKNAEEAAGEAGLSDEDVAKIEQEFDDVMDAYKKIRGLMDDVAPANEVRPKETADIEQTDNLPENTLADNITVFTDSPQTNENTSETAEEDDQIIDSITEGNNAEQETDQTDELTQHDEPTVQGIEETKAEAESDGDKGSTDGNGDNSESEINHTEENTEITDKETENEKTDSKEKEKNGSGNNSDSTVTAPNNNDSNSGSDTTGGSTTPDGSSTTGGTTPSSGGTTPSSGGTTPSGGGTTPSGGGTTQGGSTPSNSGTTVNVTFPTALESSGSGSSGNSSNTIRLVYASNGQTMTADPSSFAPGSALPGVTGISGVDDSDITVSVESVYASQYEFAGWYTDPNDSSTRVYTVPDPGNGNSVTIYGKIRQKIVPVAITYNNMNNAHVLYTVNGVGNEAYITALPSSTLPTSLNQGDSLPGFDNNITIAVDDGNNNMSKRLEFEGWYHSANGAYNLDSSDRVSDVIPYGDNTSLSLYPGFKEKTYSIHYYNSFPEAGRILLPTGLDSEGRDSSTGLIYKENNAEDNHVEISGFHFGDSYYFPEEKQLLKSKIPTDHGLLACGIPDGDGAPGTDYIGISDRADFNPTKPGYEYVGDIDFFVAPGQSGNPRYTEEKTISGDKNLYLYSAVPVSLRFGAESGSNTLTDILVYSKAANSFKTIDELQSMIPQNEYYFKLWSDPERPENDQYWEVDNQGGNYYLSTYYYGKPVNIPYVKTIDSIASEKDLIYTSSITSSPYNEEQTPGCGYSSVLPASKTSAMSAYLNDSSYGSSGLPDSVHNVLDFVYRYNYLYYTLRSYYTLNLQNADSHVGGDVIRKSNDTTTGIYRYTFYRANATGVSLQIPIDMYYDWVEGTSYGTVSRTGTFNTRDYSYVGKPDYRLAGFVITDQNGSHANNLIIGGDLPSGVSYSKETDAWGNTYYYFEASMEALTGMQVGKTFMLAPILTPITPFRVELTYTGAQSPIEIDKYNLKISGLERSRTPFVTDLKLGNLAVVALDGSSNPIAPNPKLTDVPLTFSYTEENGVDVYKYGSYTVDASGCLTIPITELLETSTALDSASEIQSLAYADSQKAFVDYKGRYTITTPDGYYGGSEADLAATSFDNYVPVRAYVGLTP